MAPQDTQGASRALYHCSKCGLAIVKDGEKIIRACSCEGAALLADMHAKVRGLGGLR